LFYDKEGQEGINMSLKSVLKRCAKFLVYGQPVINKYVSVAHIDDNKLLAGKKF